MQNKCSVVKFGGGIMPDGNALVKTSQLAHQNRYNVAVVSAFSGVTDKLILSSKEAIGGKYDSFESVKTLHDGIWKDNVTDQMHNNVYQRLKQVQNSGVRTEADRAYIESYGEKICAYLFSKESGFVVRTPEEIGLGAKGSFLEAVADGKNFNVRALEGGNFVVPGFYGVDGGKPKLFGRGGSDYSAAFVAAQMGADELHFWKNVDGYMSADPRIVGGAFLRTEMDFHEVEGLGYFGSKIIHPRAAEVLKDSDIIVWIKNFYSPENLGTKVTKQKSTNGFSIAYKDSVALVSIETTRMAEHAGFAAKIFGLLGRHGIVVDGIGTSQTSISFTINMSESQKTGALLQAAGYSPKIREDVSLIAVIGDSISSASLLSRTFSVIEKLGEQDVELITKGQNMELSIVVESSHSRKIITNLHESLMEAHVQKEMMRNNNCSG